jgi:hypothetical protein
MALGINKILLGGTANIANNAGAYFQPANVVINTAGANLNVVLTAGVYYANTPSNCSIYANLGSNVVVLGANTAGLVVADGATVFANTTTNGTLILITVNGGQVATGTFTS